MHPRIQEALQHLDRHRELLRSAVESVPPALQARRPTADSWSVVEVVEHLGLVESRITGLFSSSLNDALTRGLGAETDAGSIVSTLDTGALLDRRQPIAAGEAVQPHGDLSMAAAWSSLERAREVLRQAVLAADGRALGEVTAPHARLGSLNLYQWLIFLGTHEGRHAAQIREIAETLTA